MSELRALVEAAQSLRDAHTPFVSATIVRVQGSAYRRPGARVIMTADEWKAGSISAGCLERDVLSKGFWRTREVNAACVRYAEAEDALDEARGSGCQGVIDYLVERWEPALQPLAADPWLCFEHCLRTETVGTLVTLVGGPGVLGQRAFLSDGTFETNTSDPVLREQLREAAAAGSCSHAAVTHLGALELLLERIAPPPHLFIFGSGPDVTPVLVLAKHLGWTVSIWDGQPRFSARERLRAADHYITGTLAEAVQRLERAVSPLALIMNHDLALDQETLGALLSCRTLYLGALGPRRRTEQMLQRLRAAGIRPSPEQLERVHGPAGLAMGAQTPPEIALAIIAQMQQCLHQPQLAGALCANVD